MKAHCQDLGQPRSETDPRFDKFFLHFGFGERKLVLQCLWHRYPVSMATGRCDNTAIMLRGPDQLQIAAENEHFLCGGDLDQDTQRRTRTQDIIGGRVRIRNTQFLRMLSFWFVFDN